MTKPSLMMEIPEDFPLRPAIEEFKLADVAYRKMLAIGVGDFFEYESAWREFLRRIERVWTKTQAAVHDKPGWKKVEAEVSRLRREDPLLCYLRQARNVDEHSISDLAEEWNGDLQVIQKGRDLHFSWPAWDRPLLPVTNRGVTFEPPKTHLGEDIEPLKKKGKAEPRVVAEIAMHFYCDFLNRVSKDVIGPIR